MKQTEATGIIFVVVVVVVEEKVGDLEQRDSMGWVWLATTFKGCGESGSFDERESDERFRKVQGRPGKREEIR